VNTITVYVQLIYILQYKLANESKLSVSGFFWISELQIRDYGPAL